MNPFYRFMKTPRPWTTSNHKWPTDETEHLDAVLNEFDSRCHKLTDEEIALCVKWGREERQESKDKNLKNLKVSEDIDDEQIQIMGYYGQCAVARYLGLPFVKTTGTFRTADFPAPWNVEVRLRSNVKYDLKVKPDPNGDQDHWRVVLVRFWETRLPLECVGWIYARDGKKFGTKSPHGKQPFHAVPAEALRPMAELKELIRCGK